MKTDAPSTCSSCGDALSPSTLDGLCPKCVGNIIFTDASVEEIAAAANLAVPANKFFGQYELLEEIARGGMGVVFKARHLPLNRIVAIKMMLAGQLAGVRDAERFRAEAEAVARLQHPNIVAIHEVGEHEGFQFFSMDYVAGVNLAELVRSEILQPKRAANYLKTIAEAIHYAHQQGIIHRDLKLSNILLDAADQPRVTDFGLAKRLAGSAESTLQQLTITGQVLGTPAFIPPEQADGRHQEVGPRSDIYSLGAVLYFMLTGQPAFSGQSLEETLSQVVHRAPVSPRAINSAVPHDLETICLKCLEKEPARRYASAQELADDLGRFLRDEPITARPVAQMEKFWRVCKRHPAIVGLIMSLTVTLVVSLALLGDHWAALFEKQIIPDMPTRSANGVSGMIDGKLYVTTPADGTDGYRNFFHVYDPRLNTWNRLTEPPIPHGSGASGVINGKLYIVGGSDWHGIRTSQLDVFDPSIDTWTTKMPMPTVRGECAGAVFNGKLYVIGGADLKGNLLGAFESYDPQRDAWVMEVPMPTPRGGMGVAVMDGKLYVVGGTTDKTRSAIVEVYDFASKKWALGPPLPERRTHPFVTTLNGRLYVAGGDVSTNVSAATSSLLTLDKKTAKWQVLAPMPEPRFHGDGAQVLNGRIWFLGGWTFETNFASVHANVFIYNPRLNVWTSSGTAQ